MKSLLLSVFAFASLSVFAAESKVALGVVRSAAPNSIKTAPLCPDGVTCFTNGTIVNMVFTPAGCLDNALQPVYEQVGQDVYVHAQVNSPDDNKRVRCVAMPIVTEQLQLIMLFPPFKLHFLGTNQTIEVK